MNHTIDLMRVLGMTSKYKGYLCLAEAVDCAMKVTDRPMKITKDIYPVVARKFESTPKNIEHNIRTIVNVCWITNKEGIEMIAGHTLTYKPTNSEFIDMLAFYLSHLKEEIEEKEEQA